MGAQRPTDARKAALSLTGGSVFQAVYKAGRRYASPVATIYVLEQPGRDISLGIPAGRRLGSAVSRNRVRRRIREAFARVRPAMTRGAHVVVVPRSRALAASFTSLVQALENAVSRTGLLSDSGNGRDQRSQ